MSGLLVKSTLIMRENLEELNALGLADIPVLLGGAALTRTYVERDLREVYDGRLFYGKDAFEGLRAMDHARRDQAHAATTTPTSAGCRAEPGARPHRVAARRGDDAGRASRPAPPTSPTDNPVFTPPFLGSQVAKGIALDDIAGYINETALFRNQWQFRPEKADGDRDRRRVQGPHPPDPARAAGRGQGRRPARAPGRLRLLPGQRRRQRPRRLDRRRPAPPSWLRFTFPRQRKAPFLCIADFFRPGRARARPTTPPSTSSRWASRSASVTAELFAADRYQEYLLLHGLVVEMTEALAEFWHRRIREEWGFADEDGPTLAGLFRQQYRGGRYSWGYPACPDLEDNAKVAELLDADRIGVEVTEETGFQYQPEQTTSAIICHHPEAKYFVAR